MGLIDIEDAIREYYSDLDEFAIQSKIVKAKEIQRQNQLAQQVDMNDEGTFDDNNGDNNGDGLSGDQLDGSTFNYQ